MFKYKHCGITISSEYELYLLEECFFSEEAQIIYKIKNKIDVEYYDDALLKICPYDVKGEYIIIKTKENRSLFIINNCIHFEVYLQNGICIVDTVIKNERILFEYCDTILTELFTLAIKQLGFMVLHAGCVHFNKKNIAIFGDGGSGKSTLVTAMCLNGSELISEDIIVASLSDSKIVYYGGTNSIKLWNKSYDALLSFAPEENSTKLGNKNVIDVKKIFKVYDKPFSVTDFIYPIRVDNLYSPEWKNIGTEEKITMLLRSQMLGFANDIKDNYKLICFVKSEIKKNIKVIGYENNLYNIKKNAKYILETI